MKGRYGAMPGIVRKILHFGDGWVVGGAAVETNPKDIDILIPFSEWAHVAAMIPSDAKPNSFGGWKFVVDGIEVDVWPQDLHTFVTGAHFKVAWHPARDIYLGRAEDKK